MTTSTDFAAVNPRDLIMAIGPRVQPGARLKAFFCIVGTRAGLHPRLVKAAWFGEQVSPRTIQSLREAAAAHATRQQALDLAAQLETLSVAIREIDAARGQAHGDVFDEGAGYLRRMADRLRSVDRP